MFRKVKWRILMKRKRLKIDQYLQDVWLVWVFPWSSFWTWLSESCIRTFMTFRQMKSVTRLEAYPFTETVTYFPPMSGGRVSNTDIQHQKTFLHSDDLYNTIIQASFSPVALWSEFVKFSSVAILIYCCRFYLYYESYNWHRLFV